MPSVTTEMGGDDAGAGAGGGGACVAPRAMLHEACASSKRCESLRLLRMSMITAPKWGEIFV